MFRALAAASFRVCHPAGHFASWSEWWRALDPDEGTGWSRYAAAASPRWFVKVLLEWSGRGVLLRPRAFPQSWLRAPFTPWTFYDACRLAWDGSRDRGGSRHNPDTCPPSPGRLARALDTVFSWPPLEPGTYERRWWGWRRV